MKQENAVDQATVRDLRKGRGGNYGKEGREGIKLCLRPILTVSFKRSPHISEAITFMGSLSQLALVPKRCWV